MTTSLSSSLDMLSLTSSTRWASDSTSDEDEIVWSLSSSGVLSSSSPLNSPLSDTADFVLVPRVDTNMSAPATTAAATIAAAAATTTTTVATATATTEPAIGQATLPLPPKPPLTPDVLTDEMAALSLSTSSASASAPVPVPAKRKGRKKKSAGPLSATTTTAAADPGAPTPPAPVSSAAPRGIPSKPKRNKARAHSSSSSSSSAGGLSTIGIAKPPSASGLSSSSPPKPNKSNITRRRDGHPSSFSSSSSSSAVKALSKSKGRTKKGATALAPAPAAPATTLATFDKEKFEKPIGLGLRAVVDDSLSEASGEERLSTAVAGVDSTTVGYHEAQKFMTSYLAHPPAPGNNGSALLMLQALILELGCLPNVAAGKFSIPELPGSLRQARTILKSRAFINVRDYLAVREQGQAALQRVMHPSRKSLVQEVRKGKRVPVHEVKKAGLNVLLVNTRF